MRILKKGSTSLNSFFSNKIVSWLGVCILMAIKIEVCYGADEYNVEEGVS